MASAPTTLPKPDPKSLSAEEGDLRTAHACISESNLTTVKDFMKIKLSKEPPVQVQRALVSAEKQDAPLPEARPSKSESQMKQIQHLVVSSILVAFASQCSVVGKLTLDECD
ncbi:hypothetical protein Y032_0179g721 [Ancylostoma ceylanicum]|nr:hypothetical protein Y032_0179g721 [Ancylostoma ceylanicum]